ncbi:DEAD/DEAH box helicase [Stomatohabitans albus]|uniref:DEAD/DEAH box helicase n=1 Tax=Stomatohabitans albus TaxID=3110766 RepID=UPI00300C47A2
MVSSDLVFIPATAGVVEARLYAIPESGLTRELPGTEPDHTNPVRVPLRGAYALAERFGIDKPTATTVAVVRPADGADHVDVQEVPALVFRIDDVLEPLLAQIHHPRASVRGWAHVAQLALIAAIRQEIVPALAMATPDSPVKAYWKIAADSVVHDALNALANAMPPVAVSAPVPGHQAVRTPLAVVSAFANAVVDTIVRRGAPAVSGRPRARILPWTMRWVEALSDPDDAQVPLRDEAAELVAGIAGWQSRIDADLALIIALDAPDSPTGVWPLTCLVRFPDGHEEPVHEVLTAEQAGEADVVLAQLSRASRLYPPLDELIEATSRSVVDLTLDQAWQLIVDIAPLLQGAGVTIRLPETLAEDAMAAEVHLNEQEDGSVEAVWEVSLAQHLLDETDIATIAEMDQPLVYAHGRWIRLDETSRQAIQSYGHRETMSRAEALSLALAGSAGEDWFSHGPAAQRVVMDDSLSAFIQKVRQAGDKPELEIAPEGFVGELRDYQARGLAWLRGMTDLGLGAVLADAMGLGKTVQLIALLVTRPGPFLVVCPTSVVGNWEREIKRFAPDLPVNRHHGPERSLDPDDLEGVVVTSYGTLRRDADLLSGITWDIVTLDEAQQIKNPATAAAKVVRSLRANTMLALTGTPMENRLAELWAVIDATNTGMLGTKTAFTRRFVKPVEGHHDLNAAARLRNLVAPFIMRRTKDDPEVARDLPDKIERTVACTLTSEQAKLYEQVTQQAMAELATADGMQRRGRILAMLTALKQVTNHPAQYLGEDGPLIGRSGKLQAAQEIIASATDAGEQLLVFTQFVTMGKLLSKQLSEDLDQPVPFLHGTLSLAQRDAMVEQFQSGGGAGVLIVSTRAGGTGLNLTAATHVIHYDRWWNPAVEDQATDRAHRIGQLRTVEVHKLVTNGTLEERIADMLERKRALADAVVAPGENWITELDLAALEELVRLGAEARIYDTPDRPAIGAGYDVGGRDD